MRDAGGTGPLASRRRRLFFAAPALLLLALSLAACAGGGARDASDTPQPPATPRDGVLTVRAFEWGFAPDAIVLQRGEQVRIVLANEGAILHNLKVEELAADGIESRSSGPLSAEEGELFVGAAEGEDGTLTFVPQQPGTFVFYCAIRGHRQQGMEGVLTVE